MSRPFGVARDAPLKHLPRATRFSEDGDLRDAVAVVRYVKGQPAILAELLAGFQPELEETVQATMPVPTVGRQRVDGDWPLLFLAFVLSRVKSVQHWAHLSEHSPIWQTCGFAEPVSYATVNRRFKELEQQLGDSDPGTDGFSRAFRACLAHARSFEPQIGRAVTIDGHAAATRASLTHACPPHTPCGQRQLQRSMRRTRGKAPKQAAHGVRMQPLSSEEINADRHAEAAEPVDDRKPAKRSDRALTVLSEERVHELGLDPALKWWSQKDGKETHYFCCLDVTAGARMYGGGKGGGKRRRKKFWIGWNGQTATDSLTGCALGLTYIPNEEQEYHAYPRVMNAVTDAIGHAPHAVSLDAGYGTKAVYRENVDRGIATVAPWRKTQILEKRRQLEDEYVDRHGIPRCQHCGAPGKTNGSGLGFHITSYGTPVVRFRCRAKLTDHCRRVQLVDCRHEPRLLGPLRRDTKLYNQLRQAHSPKERVHLHARQRYSLASREIADRDYRLGIGWQQLRANAAVFLDWFRLCLRHGWFGSLRQATNAHELVEFGDGDFTGRIRDARRRLKLDLPYGPKAAAMGIGALHPPWKLESSP